jgi:hypothetical protein
VSQLISISSTEKRQFHGIVRSKCLGNELLGKLGFIRFKPDGKQEITVLCQITSVDRHNVIHEDSSFGPVIAEQGSIPYLSGIGDYEKAVAKPIAQQLDNKPTALRANPPSGTPIVSLDDESVSKVSNPQEVFTSFSPALPQFLRYGGTLSGETIKVPFICNSFNPADEDGWGEAKHAGFFGRQGSGKTHAAKIMLALNLLTTPTMGAFIPDSKNDFVKPGPNDLDLKALLESNDRPVEVIKINDLKLEKVEHFREFMLMEKLHKQLISTISEKYELLFNLTLSDFSDDNDNPNLAVEKINFNNFRKSFNENIALCFASESPKKQEERQTIAKALQEKNQKQLEKKFNKILERFTNGQSLNEIVDGVLQKGKIYFLELEAGMYDNPVNVFILEILYRRFRSRVSQLFYKSQYSNGIVYVDEANRFIPQTPTEEQKDLAKELIQGIKTTRQYGLGWWFADQRPAAISKDVFTQLGTYFFGKGMTAAADKENMESIIGKEGLQIYEYVMSTSKRPFVASGQFVGIGSEGAVTIPIDFFPKWKQLIDSNNQDFETHMEVSF